MSNLDLIRSLEPVSEPEIAVEVSAPEPAAIAWDGRPIHQIAEEDIDADVFFQFQRMAANNRKTPDEAMRWLMMRLFLVDGDRLTIDHLSGKPSQNPDCLGFRAITKLSLITNEFISGLPVGKTSSTSGDLPDGD